MKHKNETQLKKGQWVIDAEKLPQTIRNYRDEAIRVYKSASIYNLSINRFRGKWALYYETNSKFQLLAGGTPLTVGLAILTFASGFDSCKSYTREKERAASKRKPSARKVKTKKTGGSLF